MSKIRSVIARLSIALCLVVTMCFTVLFVARPVSAVATTMQEYDDSMCANIAVGTSFTLIDARGDQKSYTIAKLADENCWMTQNLALGSNTSNTVLTPADSNVSANFTIQASAVQTSGDAAWDDTSVHVYIQSGSDSINSAPYGNLYNWYAATAGTGTSGMTNANATADICPKGWRLPDGGSSTDKSFKSLDIAMGGTGANRSDSTQRDKYRATPYLFPYSGFYYGGPLGQGSYGFWWSRSAYTSSSDAYGFALNSGGGVYPQYYDSKLNGFSVRCVLDNPITPGETDITANIEEVLSLSLTSSGTTGSYNCDSTADPTCSGTPQRTSTTLLPGQADLNTMYTIATVNTNSINGYDLTLSDSDTNNALVGTSDSTATISAINSEPVGSSNPGWSIAVDKESQTGTITWLQVPISTATPLTIKSSHPDPAAVTINAQTKVTYGVAASSTQPNDTYTDTVVFTVTTGV